MAPAPLTAADLGAFPLFADLSDPERQAFLEGSRGLSLAAGQQVVQEADWSDGVFLVRQGIAKLRPGPWEQALQSQPRFARALARLAPPAGGLRGRARRDPLSWVPPPPPPPAATGPG
jgi:hypothetical protein